MDLEVAALVAALAEEDLVEVTAVASVEALVVAASAAPIIVAHVLVTDITVVRAFLALVPVITDTEAEDALVVC